MAVEHRARWIDGSIQAINKQRKDRVPLQEGRVTIHSTKLLLFADRDVGVRGGGLVVGRNQVPLLLLLLFDRSNRQRLART